MYDIEEIEEIWLRILQRDIYQRDDPEIAPFSSFQSEFGVDPVVAEKAYVYIRKKISTDVDIDYHFHRMRRIHVLMGLKLLRSYDIEKRLYRQFNLGSENTYAKWAHFVISQLHDMSFDVVSSIGIILLYFMSFYCEM